VYAFLQKKLCILLTGGAYAPYPRCMSTQLDVITGTKLHRRNQ